MRGSEGGEEEEEDQKDWRKRGKEGGKPQKRENQGGGASLLLCRYRLGLWPLSRPDDTSCSVGKPIRDEMIKLDLSVCYHLLLSRKIKVATLQTNSFND